MRNTLARAAVMLLCVAPLNLFAAEAPTGDTRVLVDMPAGARELMRREMLDNLVVLNQIIGYLAAGDLKAAADIADERLGRGAMGRYRGNKNAPGRYMPQPMHAFGFQQHDAADEFAAIARKGDAKAAWVALQNVTNACVGCHLGFRTR
jgi:hypothetical protein